MHQPKLQAPSRVVQLRSLEPGDKAASRLQKPQGKKAQAAKSKFTSLLKQVDPATVTPQLQAEGLLPQKPKSAKGQYFDKKNQMPPKSKAIHTVQVEFDADMPVDGSAEDDEVHQESGENVYGESNTHGESTQSYHNLKTTGARDQYHRYLNDNDPQMSSLVHSQQNPNENVTIVNEDEGNEMWLASQKQGGSEYNVHKPVQNI